MKKVLVHLHIFYHDQVDYFIEKLRNISGVEWDLVVTWPNPEKSTLQKIINFKPDARFIEVGNFGFDIWPFIQVMQSSDLSQYDFVIKLHTKRALPKEAVHKFSGEGFEWRNSLVDALLYDKNHFQTVLSIFEKNPKVGMVSSLKYYLGWDFYSEYVLKELNNIGLSRMDSHTCMGTIFMGRAEIFNFLKNDKIRPEKFQSGGSESGTSISFSHIYERIFSHLPVNLSLQHKPVSHSRKEFRKLTVKRRLENILKFIFTMERCGPDRKKILKVLGVTLYKSKRGKAENDSRILNEMFNE